MDRLNEIKEEQALNHLFLSYDQVKDHYKKGLMSQNTYEDFEEDVVKQYAEECVKASLEKASEKACAYVLRVNENKVKGVVEKESIISKDNIVLL